MMRCNSVGREDKQTVKVPSTGGPGTCTHAKHTPIAKAMPLNILTMRNLPQPMVRMSVSWGMYLYSWL